MVSVMDVRVEGSSVIFESEANHGLKVTFHRTLRLPEDGKKHRLPPSLGAFPIKRVDDYKDKVPAAWAEHGGVFFPMWQREAMWMSFGGEPTAVKVAAGKVNAVSGKPWNKELAASQSGGKDPIQDYLVANPQPWLDGFNVGDGVIKQFVAMPLGMGYSVEGQVTGKEEFGGLQLLVVPSKEGKIPRRTSQSRSVMAEVHDGSVSFASSSNNSWGDQVLRSASTRSRAMGSSVGEEQAVTVNFTKAAEMGLAMGGQMEQKIYPDPYGIDVWDQAKAGKLFVHIVNSQMYEQITGEKPPASPITAQTYAQHGYPWFALYDEHMGDVPKSETLSGVKTLSEMDKTKGFEGQQDDSPIEEKSVIGYHVHKPGAVRNGTW